MKTTIAISCLLMGASFASDGPTISHAAEDADADRGQPSEIDKAVSIAQRTEGVITVKNDLKVEDA